MNTEQTISVEVELGNNPTSQKQGLFARNAILFALKHCYKPYRIVLACIVAFSALLRIYHFPAIPTGLNVDEAYAGYETYSLIMHGTDRWGDRWPIYFPNWGSGQNVLQSYLNIPFVKLFGLSTFSERLLPMLLGVLSILLVYFVVRKVYDKKTGLIAAFLLGTIPWHIMISRWSLESNILPFFLLLGVWILVSCYTSKYCARLIPFSLVGLAIAFYAYGVSVVVIPWIILLFWIFNVKTIWRHKNSFILSIVVFLVIAAPFLLFILDNNILHRTPTIVKHLPFTVPLLPSSRLEQVTGRNSLRDNIFFFTNGFNDGLPWNVMNAFLPLGVLNIPLTFAGIYFSLRRRVQVNSVFLFWFLATLPMFFLFDLNINRANALFLPVVVLSAVGIGGIYTAISARRDKIAVLSLILAAMMFYNALFCYNYFHTYNSEIRDNFHANFDVALSHSNAVVRKNEPMYISTDYIYVLFYLKVDSADFRAHANISVRGGSYIVENYRNYIFEGTSSKLASVPSYVALLHSNETIVSCRRTQVFYRTGQWKVERCFKS